MAPVIEKRLFINGDYVESKSSDRLACYNPANNSVAADGIHVASEADVNEAVASARKAFPAWASTAPAKRAAILLKLADLIEANADEIGDLEALTSDYAGWCDKLHGEAAPSPDGYLRIVTHEPLGVCAAICPFNAPVVLAACKAAPALAAGNTIVIKSSEKTPLGTLVLGRLANEAGVPNGVINILSGAGATGALLATHMDVNKISFTGSNPTGKKIAQMAAASNLKRVSLELGGKSPAIIFPDANLEAAVQWCVAGIVNMCGQMCIANSRIYVHEAIKDEFLAAFKQGICGAEASGKDSGTGKPNFGPLIDKMQLERVVKFIESGKEEAELFYGGAPIGDEGCFIQPTVFVNASPTAKVYKEEIFGPVTVVSTFNDEDDVIARANDTEYGLSAGVFSQDLDRALRVASKIHSGTVCVNCTVQNQVDVPFGGVKQSGWGRENGQSGILDCTEPKTTFIKYKG